MDWHLLSLVFFAVVSFSQSQDSPKVMSESSAKEQFANAVVSRMASFMDAVRALIHYYVVWYAALQSKTVDDVEVPDEKPKIPISAWIVVALVTFANFAGTYLAIAPAVASYSIVGALGSFEKRIWIITAQSIPSIVTSPFLGIVADCP